MKLSLIFSDMNVNLWSFGAGEGFTLPPHKKI